MRHKKKSKVERLVTFAIAIFMSLSAISMISVTVRGEPVVDGVISPGEYSSGLHIVLEGPWDSPSSPYDGPLDGYLYWDTQYLWIAVNEPVPEWGGGGSFIEFMWDAGIHGTMPYYHAWVLFSDGNWQSVRCGKPTGCWGWAADPFPGHSWWATNTATEFKFDYTDYGTQYGDTIKLIVDSADRSASSLTFGNCQIWPYVSPSNPDYYPCETPSSVATWGTIVLSGTGNPTADAGGPYSGLIGASILLDGSGSYDLDGTIVSYEWDLDHDGFYDDATGSTTTHSWSSEGTYTISLKVTDDDGAFDTDDTTVNIGDHAVDGVITPGEYDGGMAVELVKFLWTVDAYIDWDCQYMYVAVDEPVPTYIEFAFDAGAARDRWDIFGMFPGSPFYQFCLKSGGGWNTGTSPGAYSAVSNTATEFKFDYTAFGIVRGDTIKMCIERGSIPNAFWPEGGIIWSAPGRRPDPSTWGDVTLTGSCPPSNIPPVADANGPYSGGIRESIHLDGTGSYDPDGTIVSYEWDLDHDGFYDDATGSTPTHSWCTAGTYPISLKVTDDDGAFDTDDTTVNIGGSPPNIPPTADFTYSPASPTDLDLIQFTDASTDSDGTIASWSWDFDDGDTSTLQNPTHDYADDGTYHVTLTVTDDDGASDSITKDVIVSNVEPTADFTYSPISPTDLDLIQFTDASTDSDGTIASWSWDFDDGDTSTLQNPTHDYADDGTYHVTLTVTDDDGASDSITIVIVVSNVDPTADADGPYIGTTDYAIQFNGSGSYDPDGVIVSYEWDFGDGDTGLGEKPTHIYDKYGVYDVTLLVTDDDGSTDVDETLAAINKGAPPIMQLLYPADGDVLKGTVTVKWYAHDFMDGDTLPLYIYFKDVDDTLFSAFTGNPYPNTGMCQWVTTTLPDGTYKLLIEAFDSEGNMGADISTFEIKNHEQPPTNDPPAKPNTPSGQKNGNVGQEYSYTTSTTDPDGDKVYYLWDWGDGNNSGWLGPYNSGDIISATHKWSVKGPYSIKVKAKDIYGKESVWSDPLPITMPFSYHMTLLQLLQRFFERFPHAFPILRQLLGY